MSERIILHERKRFYKKNTGMIVAFLMLLIASLVITHGQNLTQLNSPISVSSMEVQFENWWPMFHHDLRNTGYSTSTAPGTNTTIWNYTTGTCVWSSPAVVNGRVYVGSNNSRMYCLDALTGEHLWNYTTGFDVVSSPAVVEDRVYVGSGDRNVYCLNATTGTKIWNYTTGGGVYSSPAVVEDRVYVGSGDRNVYCLNASTGTKIWNYTTSNVPSSPAIAYGNVYVESKNDRVYCLNASTGTHIWNYTINGPPRANAASSPAVADGKVYAGSFDGNIYCLNASTGTKIWNYTTGGGVYSSPAVADGKVYIGSDCLNATAGTYIWGYTKAIGWSSPAVADGKVYVGSDDYNVYAFGPAHDVAVTGVVPSETVVMQNDSLPIAVTVENQGSYVESFNVTAYYDSNIIETQSISDLALFSQTILMFNWNTTELSLGSYRISAVADTVPGETDTADNSLSGGRVDILDWVGAVLYVDPPVTHTEVNETITVNVKVKNVTDLWAVQVGLNYDPTKLEFIEASLPEDWPLSMSLGPYTDLMWPDPSPGYILWGALGTSPDYWPSFNGTTVLVRLTFKVVAPGSSEIVMRLEEDYLRSNWYYDQFWECILLDSGINDIAFRSLNGEVTTETDWPMYHYNPACTSFSFSMAPSTNSTVWISDLPGGTVWAYPVVAEGKVFIGAGGYLNAFDEDNGSLLWSYRAPGQPGYPVVAAVADGKVFFGTAEPGPEGAVYALNMTTGEQIWNFTTEGYLRPIVIVEDRLYFGVDLDSTGKVYCISANDGAHIWNYTTQDRGITVAVEYDRVYVGCGHWTTSETAAIYCLNMYDGDLIWSFDTGRDLGGLGSVANGKVYCCASREGSNHAIFALNANNGDVVWSTTRYSNGEGGRFAVAYGKVFFATGRGSKGIYALNETNGKEIWSFPFSLGAAGGGPVVADGKVFVAEGNPSHMFYAINETTGTVIWKYQLGGAVHSLSSAIANGRVFVADHYDSKLYAFGPKHDIAVLNVTTSKIMVCQNCTMYVNVTVENQGDFTETLNVTAHANTTIINTNETVLTSGSSTTISFVWNTTGWTAGNYTISAYATQLPEEIDTSDNLYVDGVVQIIPPRDLAITNILPSTRRLVLGETLDINVTVENQGPSTETFNVTVTLTYEFLSSIIRTIDLGTQMITLSNSSATVLTFNWEPTTGLKGWYRISADVTQMPCEIDTADNTYVDDRRIAFTPLIVLSKGNTRDKMMLYNGEP